MILQLNGLSFVCCFHSSVSRLLLIYLKTHPNPWGSLPYLTAEPTPMWNK